MTTHKPSTPTRNATDLLADENDYMPPGMSMRPTEYLRYLTAKYSATLEERDPESATEGLLDALVDKKADVLAAILAAAIVERAAGMLVVELCCEGGADTVVTLPVVPREGHCIFTRDGRHVEVLNDEATTYFDGSPRIQVEVREIGATSE